MQKERKIQSGLTCTPTLPPCQGHTCYRTLQYSVCLAESHSCHEVHSGTWMVVLNDQAISWVLPASNPTTADGVTRITVQLLNQQQDN